MNNTSTTAAHSYDVVIVGAGAGGCAAALSLPAGTRALLIERSEPGAHRCCGGLLTTDASRSLAALDLSIPPEILVEPQPLSVRAHDLDSGREQSYHRAYLNLDRCRFDEWLLNLASKRVEVKHGAAFLARTRGGVRVRIDGAIREVRTGLVIGADGANSTVRRACLGRHSAPRKMLAIQAYLHSTSPLPNHEVLFASGLTGFYAWGISKPGAVIVGDAFHDRRRCRESFDEIVNWYRRSFDLGSELQPRSVRYLSQPWARNELLEGETGLLLVGEAAGLVSPSSGEGISYAISSGAAAGRSVGSPEPLSVYRRQFDELATAVMRKKWKARVIYSPRLRSMALRIPWCP